MFRIATWNVNSIKARLQHVRRWADQAHPDVIALQETKTQDADFPASAFQDAGYRILYAGQKSYNGVAVASRRDMECVATRLPDFDDPQQRFLHARVPGLNGERSLEIVNVYVPNGSEVGSDKYGYKLEWLERLHVYVGALLAEGRELVLLGDFNIAPADRDVHDPQRWEGQVLVSEPERAAFRKLEGLGLKDCYRVLSPETVSYSWWDYRAAAFRRNMGLRIDLILTDPATAARCHGCEVDPAPRRWERPSDHAPVWADFDF
jgi:exodeoxyribonuclease-3